MLKTGGTIKSADFNLQKFNRDIHDGIQACSPHLAINLLNLEHIDETGIASCDDYFAMNLVEENRAFVIKMSNEEKKSAVVKEIAELD